MINIVLAEKKKYDGQVINVNVEWGIKVTQKNIINDLPSFDILFW